MKKLTLLFTLAILLFLGSCSNPERAFKKAKEINTIEAYNGFINKFPDNSLVLEAKSGIRSLTPINNYDTMMNKLAELNIPDSVRQLKNNLAQLPREKASSLYNRIRRDLLYSVIEGKFKSLGDVATNATKEYMSITNIDRLQEDNKYMIKIKEYNNEIIAIEKLGVELIKEGDFDTGLVLLTHISKQYKAILVINNMTNELGSILHNLTSGTAVMTVNIAYTIAESQRKIIKELRNLNSMVLEDSFLTDYEATLNKYDPTK